MALQSIQGRSVEVAVIKQLFSWLSRPTPARLFHMRGHQVLLGHEVADHLAVRACSQSTLQAGRYSKLVIQSSFSAEIHKDWQSDWQTNPRNTELFTWVTDVLNLSPDFPPPRPVLFSCDWARPVPVSLTQDIAFSLPNVLLWSRLH